MALLSDHKWKSKYTPDDGDLVQRFYVQALDAAVRQQLQDLGDLQPKVD